LNSRLFVFIYRLLAIESGRVLAQVKPTVLGVLPIRAIDFGNDEDLIAHDRLVKLVEQRIELQKLAASSKTPQEMTSMQREILSNEAQINNLVYALYLLSAEDIDTVENALKVETSEKD
jgi:hypothetical protein